MDGDSWFFGVVPSGIGAIIGILIGRWLGSYWGFTVLGIIIGGVLGVICALFISTKIYGWEIDELEEEWREERNKWKQTRKKDGNE